MPPKTEIITVRDHIAWSYANLARADAALSKGAEKYSRLHHMIRAKLFKGLREQTMQMSSIYKDERLKMTLPQACYYCGDDENLAVDHLIPRIKGGRDEADNLIWACRSCNSSKRDKDMLSWLLDKDDFPSILLLRRYIKLVARYCESKNLLDEKLEEVLKTNLPFSLERLPYTFPPLQDLKLWIYPTEREP
ncbi:HNH endonuclease [Pontiellaceae bacterium B12227]|nr:HNH endonuclease [Pontiellaceae bacterium B12227]